MDVGTRLVPSMRLFISCRSKSMKEAAILEQDWVIDSFSFKHISICNLDRTNLTVILYLLMISFYSFRKSYFTLSFCFSSQSWPRMSTLILLLLLAIGDLDDESFFFKMFSNLLGLLLLDQIEVSFENDLTSVRLILSVLSDFLLEKDRSFSVDSLASGILDNFRPTISYFY